eukprot:365555-Chlamydomonas_euryale.AAC.24
MHPCEHAPMRPCTHAPMPSAARATDRHLELLGETVIGEKMRQHAPHGTELWQQRGCAHPTASALRLHRTIAFEWVSLGLRAKGEGGRRLVGLSKRSKAPACSIFVHKVAGATCGYVRRSHAPQPVHTGVSVRSSLFKQGAAERRGMECGRKGGRAGRKERRGWWLSALVLEVGRWRWRSVLQVEIGAAGGD